MFLEVWSTFIVPNYSPNDAIFQFCKKIYYYKIIAAIFDQHSFAFELNKGKCQFAFNNSIT